jgi:hypothetical protein
MLQSARHVYRAWLRRPTFWRNAENDLDVVLIDFDLAHHGVNNLPPAVAIETVESLHDLGGEISVRLMMSERSRSRPAASSAA